jgi:hypothetical protein
MTADEQAIRDLVATWMAATKAGDTAHGPRPDGR